MLTRLFTCLLSLICAFSAMGVEYDDNPVCGTYSATSGGGTIEIFPIDQLDAPLPEEFKPSYSLTEQYAIILRENPSPNLQPGTVMGWLSPLAKTGQFDAIIMTKEKDGKLTAPRRFILELNPDGSLLSMLEIKKRLRLDPLRFLPYLFHGVSLKGTLKMEDNTDRAIQGFIKLTPRPSIPLTPRML